MPTVHVYHHTYYAPNPEGAIGIELLQFCRNFPGNLEKNAKRWGFQTDLAEIGTEVIFIPYSQYDVVESRVHFQVMFEEALSEPQQAVLRDELAERIFQALGKLINSPRSMRLSVSAGSWHGAMIKAGGVDSVW